MSQLSTPAWYVPDDLRATVANARAADTPREAVVSFLADEAMAGTPRERIERIVAAVPEESNGSSDGDLNLSQEPSTSDEPRPQPARRFSVADVEYLADDEFARVLALAAAAFDDEAVLPPGDNPFDLYWERDDETLGVRAVTATGESLSADVVETASAAEDAETDVATDRVVVATNGLFTDDATAVADDAGVTLLARGRLETVLERAMLPTPAVGTVLEAGEEHDDPTEGIESVEMAPGARRALGDEPTRTAAELRRVTDPDDVRPDTSDSDVETTSDDTESQPETVTADDDTESGGGATADDDTGGFSGGAAEEDQPAGERGVLYADPDEDGDYDAFEDFAEGI